MLVRVDLVRVEAYEEEGIRGRWGGQEWKTRELFARCSATAAISGIGRYNHCTVDAGGGDNASE